jgi:signal transduction histidine kinase/CheY-like chemotaxis protein
MDSMQRLLYLFLLVIPNWFCLTLVANPTVAQTPYAAVCRAELASTKSDSAEQLMAMLKLTDALRGHDLNVALKNAEEAIQQANRLGDPDLKTVAKLHETLIRGLKFGRKKADAELKFSDFRLSPNAPLDLRIHWHLAIVEMEIWSLKTDSRLPLLLECLNADTKHCRDPHLRLRQQSSELYARVFRLSESPTSAPIRALRDSLRLNVERYPFLECEIVLKLVNSRELAQRRDTPGQFASLEAARSLADQLGHRFFAARGCSLIGILHCQKGEYEKAAEEFEDCLEIAKKIGFEPLIYQSYRKLANIERRLGNSSMVRDYLKLAGASPVLDDISGLERSAFFAYLTSVQRELGEHRETETSQAQVFPVELARQIRASQHALRNQAEDEKAMLRERHLQTETTLAETIGALRMYLGIALLSSAFCILCVALIVIRNRLRKVTSELDLEKVNVRQSNHERDDLALRLIRMQRMESLGLMAGSVAHDFNNILVGVLGNAEIIQMKQGGDDPEFINQRIASIITSAEKAASLSQQMLAYAGKQYIARKTTDLNELIRQYEPVLRSFCLPNQHLELRLTSKQVTSKIDRTQIEQVVLNLVTNAVQASGPHGHITIESGVETISDVDQDPSLFGDPTVGGEFGFVEVRDKGRGVSAEVLERIFEPFYSNSESGRGLGLSVVYGAVKGHEGLIRCRSQFGVGTSFRVFFPVSTEPVQKTKTESGHLKLPGHHADFPRISPGRTILIVDDEESVLDLCRQLMQLNGWKVITALGGKQGLEKAEKFADEVSCVLLDVVMPEFGASEVLTALEDRKYTSPVVLMSGFSQTRLEFFLKRPNVVSIIQKPFRAEELQRAVHLAAQQSDLQSRPNLKSGRIGKVA